MDQSYREAPHNIDVFNFVYHSSNIVSIALSIYITYIHIHIHTYTYIYIYTYTYTHFLCGYPILPCPTLHIYTYKINHQSSKHVLF